MWVENLYFDYRGYYKRIENAFSFDNDTLIRFEGVDHTPSLRLEDYGKTWLVYKNKEQVDGVYDKLQSECDDKERYTIELYERARHAERELKEIRARMEKGEIVELPCKIGDTVYWVYSPNQKEPISFVAEDISGKILDDGVWRWFVTNRYGYGGVCSVLEKNWYLGKDKTEAELRLAELRGEKK